MATTLPRPSRPQMTTSTSSTSSLPTLPISKSRKSLGSALPSLSPNAGPRTLTHSPSTTSLSNGSTDSVNSLKTLRRTVSIATFPQPPRTPGSRIASLQGSPLALIGPRSSTSSGSTTPTTTMSKLSRRGSADTVSSKKSKTMSITSSKTMSSLSTLQNGSTISLLNGSGDSKSITSSGPGQRSSDGLLSIPSPPQSRSSSAQGSYATSATTNDEIDGMTADDSDSSSLPKEEKGNVIVSVRVKPEASQSADKASDWDIDGRKSAITYNGKDGGSYDYDNVFTGKDDNSKVYERCAKRLVRRTMEGFHSTVFAYGMTSSGKTYSMSGTMSSPGLIPLAITDIFGFIRSTPTREFLLRVSYLEIYNEKIYDLLAASDSSGLGNANEEIKLREDSKRGVYATPLKEEIVQSPTQLLRVIARGDQARRTGSTQFNARSSRSHAVVQIVVESRDRIAGALSLEDGRRKLAATPGGVRVSTLSLIDLAGSERAAESKERRQEGAHINRSLLTLGTIISKLSGKRDKEGNPTDSDGKHLPYRDSKLTRLLQGALSGNSLVSILCTVATGTAASATTAETLNTLKFGARARNNIVSHAKRAEESLGAGGSDGSRVLLERYRMEILSLRTELESTKREQTVKVEDNIRVVEESETRHGEQLLEMQLARTALKERIEHLNRLILSSQSTGVNSRSASAFSLHPRLSGHMSSLSMRSSVTTSTIRSSNASTIGPLPTAGTYPEVEEEEDEDVLGEFGDGQASLAQQVRALQADVADKNRYISTLERRLLQARRSSHSRMSASFSPSSNKILSMDESSFAAALKDKDAEIAELRARLDDKEKMVTALRSAARKRDVADMVNDTGSQRSSVMPVSVYIPKSGQRSPVKRSSAESKSSINNRSSAESKSPTKPSSTDKPAIKRSSAESAAAAVSSADVSTADVSTADVSTADVSTANKSVPLRKRGRSVDEMSRMLDEMINDRVESGELVKGNRGSLRLARESRIDMVRGPLSPIDLDSLKPPSAPPTMALPLPPPQQLALHKAALVI